MPCALMTHLSAFSRVCLGVCCFSCAVFQRWLSQAYGRWDATQQLCLNNRLDDAATRQTLIHTPPPPPPPPSLRLSTLSLSGLDNKITIPKALSWMLLTNSHRLGNSVCMHVVCHNNAGFGYDNAHNYTFKIQRIVCQTVHGRIRVIHVSECTMDVFILLISFTDLQHL